MKVDFIIAGFQKSGTTSLYRQLLSHPGLEFYQKGKAPEIFNRFENWQSKVEDYHSGFSNNPNVIRGESSDQYSIFPEYRGTASRIAAYNPNMKIIFIYRDPVERCLSHYDFNLVRGGAKGPSPEEVILSQSKYLNRSRYGLQLRQFLRHFPKDQIHLVNFKDYVDSFQQELDRLCDFLSVEKSWAMDQEKLHRMATVGKKHVKFRYLKFYENPVIVKLARKIPGPIRKITKSLMVNSIKEKTPFSDSFKADLWSLLETDMLEFEKEFGLDLSAWKQKYS